MTFDLSEADQELQNAAIKFATTALATDMRRADREGHFDQQGWDRCSEYGLFRLPIAEPYGGLGLAPSGLIAVMEGLGYGSRDQGLLLSLNAHLWAMMPISIHGSEEQKQRYLPGLSSGQTIAASAATEPDAGSDIFAMRTRAERRGDHYVLNGTKAFVSNGPIAGLFVIYATINPALGPMGVTAFLVERGTPGLVAGSPMEKMGLRTSPLSELTLEDVVVPLGNRLGREGRGVEVFESCMEWERGCIMATCLGAMRHLMERCIDYARRRKQFGKSISKFQSVANMIVDMKVRLDTSRPLVYRVGALKGTGRSCLLEASVAKLYVSNAFVQSCLDAMQVFGGYGYMVEQEIERELRNAVASTVYAGTSEIQKNIIARCLGL